MKIKSILKVMALSAVMVSCSCSDKNELATTDFSALTNNYAKVTLTTDISHLTDNEKQMLDYLFEAGKIMDDIFWKQTLSVDKDEFLKGITDENQRLYAEINYGPWDNFDDMKPFVEGFDAMPAGANFYPVDMTKEEFDSWNDANKESQYTLVRRDENGNLQAVWYHEAYNEEIERAATLIEKAADLAGGPEFAHYLRLRATALRTDDYFESDMAWMDVRNNNIDFVVGPIENYLDGLFGIKAAHEAFILVKDRDWSEKLMHYTTLLPQLQTELPCEDIYKQEVPGADADLAAYDVVFYGGDCNMAGKTIAINLPNDENVQLKKGTRKLQLKNAMKAKYDKILLPIAKELMTEESYANINFEAFFSNVMFHEVAHGLGIKNTIDGLGTVRAALKEQYSAIEEAKADVLGLFLVTRLNEMGEYTNSTLIENYTTFMASIFRSIRFGVNEAHGRANMLTFTYFQRENAFSRDENGKYSINFDAMKEAVKKLSGDILAVQGQGDYNYVKEWLIKDAAMTEPLATDLKKISEMGIPVDIFFEQGRDKLN